MKIKGSSASKEGKIHFNMQRLEEQMKQHGPKEIGKNTGVNQYALLSPINGGPFRQTAVPEESLEESHQDTADQHALLQDNKKLPSQDTFGIQDQMSQRMEASNTQSSFNLQKSKATFARLSKKQKDQATQMSKKNLHEGMQEVPNDSLDYFASKYKVDQRKLRKIVKKRTQVKKEQFTPTKQTLSLMNKVPDLTTTRQLVKMANKKTLNFDSLLKNKTKKKNKIKNFIDDKVLSICEKYSQRDISVDSDKQKARLKGSFHSKKEPKNTEMSKQVFLPKKLEDPYLTAEEPLEDKMHRKYSKSIARSEKSNAEYKNRFGHKPSNKKSRNYPNQIKNEIYDCYYNQNKKYDRSKSPLKNCLMNFKSSFAAIDPSQKQRRKLQVTKSTTKPLTKKYDLEKSTKKPNWESSRNNRISSTSPGPQSRNRMNFNNVKSSVSPDAVCTPKKLASKIGSSYGQSHRISQNQMTPKSNGVSMGKSPGRSYIERFGQTIQSKEARITFQQPQRKSVKKQLKEYLKKEGEKYKLQENYYKRNLSRGRTMTSGGPWSVQDCGPFDSKGKLKKSRKSRPGTNELIGEYDVLINKVIKGSEIYKKKRILEQQLRNFEDYKKNIETLLKDINK
jgi:hypothetical protein